MSDMLDRIRQELRQRLEATRAAAGEHERVRVALEALEKATRQVTGEASRRGRGLAARARPASGGSATVPAADSAAKPVAARPARASAGGKDGSATAKPGAETASARRRASAAGRAGTAARKSGARSRAGRKASAPPSTPKATSGAPKAGRAGTTGGPSPRPIRARAPRGANRAAVLAVVRERPGVTASELAAASGVTGGTLYALLRRLTELGELEKRELPGGQTGYAVGAEATSPTAAAHASRVSPADSRPEDAQAGESQAKPTAAGPASPAAKPGT